MRLIVLTCSLAVALGGCATLLPEPTPFQEVADSFVLEVENQNILDATIYVHRDVPMGSRRIGVVGGLATDTFQVAWEAPSHMAVRFDLFTGGDCTVPSVLVSPGDEIHLRILPGPDRAAYCYRE